MAMLGYQRVSDMMPIRFWYLLLFWPILEVPLHDSEGFEFVTKWWGPQRPPTVQTLQNLFQKIPPYLHLIFKKTTRPQCPQESFLFEKIP